MKTIKITMLCLLVLIQGISQSYAAQMMASMSMSNISEPQDMSDMPCHQAQNDVQVADNNNPEQECCAQDCQCHFLSSAMMHNGLSFHGLKPSKSFLSSEQSLFSFTSKNLYRPPIFA